MFRVLFLVFAVSLCQADLPVTIPTPVRCGNIPISIYPCIGNPRLMSGEVSVQCSRYTDCEQTKCIFRKSNWLDGDKVDKQKLSAFYDQFAKDNPSWALAMKTAKNDCVQKDLPAQGAFLNCPTYDIMWCTLAAFLRNAQPSQWSQSAHCSYPRQYAALCPVCPESCFATQVPYGSCNACLSLPRSP